MPTPINRGARRSVSPALAASPRRAELSRLIISTVVVVLGLFLVYQAKVARMAKPPPEQLLNLNEVESAERIEEVLTALPDFSDAERKFAAEKILEKIKAEGHDLANVGALRTIRIEPGVIKRNAEYLSLNERLDAAEKKKRDDEPKERWREEKAKASWSGQLSLAAGRVSRSVESFRRWLQLREPENGLSLLTGAQFQRLKLAFIVRRPEAFKRQFLFWAAVVIAAFYLSHFVWRMTGFKGDQTILPIVHLLCGIGLMMMVSLRDPLRDLLEFAEFAIGVLLGIAAMLACSVLCARPWWVVRRPLMQILGERISLRTSLWLLFSAATLAVILFFFGVGPRGSDAKVNLWIFQPAEAIKILVVFSLATYLAANWEYLRGLQHRGDGIFRLLRYFKAPRLVLFLPVVGAMAAMLALFAAIRDLGPALMLAVTFLSLYAIARKRYGLATCGFVVFVAGVYALYRLEWFETLNKRVDILRNVWENGLAGGDQIAHSLWAFASGGMTGMGLGLGDPDVIPAGYTDLIISAVGEELGFAGVVAVMALYAMLIAKAIRISLRAATDYEFFLALGLTLLTAFQILLITAGILAIFPLSGVVSPFLSYGKASMIANFAIFGLILGISTRRRKEEIPSPFAAPARRVSLAIGLVMLLVAGKAAWAQVFDSERIILRGVLTQLGEMKGKEIGDYDFSYNPRLIGPAEKLKRGTIFDRNGTPLASSDCEEMKKLSHRYKDFSIDIAEICKSRKRRYYPFGAKLFYLVGDPELGGNFGANYIERDYRARLHGYDDHSCLIERRVKKTRMEIEDEEFDAAERSGAWPVEPGGGTGAATPNAGAEEFAIEDELPEPHDAVDGQTRNVQPNATDRSGQTRTVKVIQRDLTELLPLLYYRYRPDHDRMRELVKRDRDLYLTIDAGLQLEAARRIEAAARNTAEKGAAAVVIDVSSGDVLASVSYPWPVRLVNGSEKQRQDDLIDRAMAGRPPGSTFKIVTAIAALRNGDALRNQKFECVDTGGGRGGAFINRKPLRDSDGHPPHGVITLEEAIVESCNGYFVQLGVDKVGSKELAATAGHFGIRVSDCNDTEPLKFGLRMAHASFGQGQVLATPLEMALVAATVANGGKLPQARWITGAIEKRKNCKDSEPDCYEKAREKAAVRDPVIRADQAAFLAGAMRGVVTRGTATRINDPALQIAGKTGTAEQDMQARDRKSGKLLFKDERGRFVTLDNDDDEAPKGWKRVFMKNPPTHAWFIGFAPYDADRKLAFSVLIERGGMGGAVAAPVAAAIAKAAVERMSTP